MNRVFIVTLFAASLCALPVLAKTYDCAPWHDNHSSLINVTSVSISARTMVTTTKGLSESVRMSNGTLERKTYIDDSSAWIVYGKPELRDGAPPGFGKEITLQHLVFHPTNPVLVQTNCEAK